MVEKVVRVDGAGIVGEDRVVATARVMLSLAQLAGRIRTGCVYEEQQAGTFGLLVTRHDPRFRWRHSRVVQAPIHAQWAELAPSVHLLTGRAAEYGGRCCRGATRHAGHGDVVKAQPRLGWDGFAAAYRAELDARPSWLCLAVVRQIAVWLCSYRTITVLSFEPSQPRGAALEAWERRGEFVPWAQRHVFREWLLSLPPMGLCVVGRAPTQEHQMLREGGVMVVEPPGV